VVPVSAPPLLLPPDFLHLYVCKCMASCARAGQDKYVQHRHVRLVCAFITTLIRKKLIDLGGGATTDGEQAGMTGAAASPSALSSPSAASQAPMPSGSSELGALQSPPGFASVAAASAGAGGGADALLVEISAFLVEFASHKEASMLYKLIKSIEAHAHSKAS